MANTRRIVVFCNIHHTPYKVEIWAPDVSAIKWLLAQISELCLTQAVWSMNYEDGKFVLLLRGGTKTQTFVHQSITTPAGQVGLPVIYLDELCDLNGVLRHEHYR